MKKVLRKVALVSAFVMVFGLGAVTNNVLEEIQSGSIVASAEDTTYTVQDIATIQNDSNFKTSYFSDCYKSVNKMAINQNTNTLYYIDDTLVYSYNIYTGELNTILDTADMSLKLQGTTTTLSNFKLVKVIVNPYNDHTYVIGQFCDDNNNSISKQDYIYDIDTQTYYQAYGSSRSIVGGSYYVHTYFYDENTLYTYYNSNNIMKYDFSKQEYTVNAKLGIMNTYSGSEYKHSIFERSDGFYYISNQCSSDTKIYYSGTFANENPKLVLTISVTDFDNYISNNSNYSSYIYLKMYDFYNNEPYILDGTCGDVYKVDIDNQDLVKYINGSGVVQTGRSYFSENICNLLMSKDGEPIFYDWKDQTIKIFKSNMTSTSTVEPSEPSTSTEEYSRFDVNRDGSVNILDLIELKRYILGEISE